MVDGRLRGVDVFGLVFVLGQDPCPKANGLAADVVNGKRDPVAKAIVYTLRLTFFLKNETGLKQDIFLVSS